MGLGVEIHILVLLFPSSQSNDFFFQTSILRAIGEGHTSLLSAQMRNYGETLPTELTSAL